MKSKTLAAWVIAAIVLTPAFALAQTTDNGNAAEIAALQQLIVLLTQELQQLLAARSAASTPTPSTPQISANYSSYTSVSMALYSADTSTYLGKQIAITGMVNSFMPRGGSGGSTNYIQVINPFDQSQPKVQLEVDNGSTYTAAVTSLQDTSSPIYQFIRAYGTGVPSQAFTATSLLGSATVMVPAVNVTRIDKCIHGSMSTTVLTGTSFDDNFTCTSWQTIAQ